MRESEKRAWDKPLEEEEEEEPQRKKHKVPALASVIVEALKVDSLQKLCSSLEPLLRRVVSEEVDRALAKLGHAKLGARSSPQQIECPQGSKLQLHFKSRLPPHLFTGGKVEGEQGAAIHVVLLDSNTGHVFQSGPESSLKLDIVVLEGDFNDESDVDWTQEQFESYEVKEREGKRPLLTGDLQVTLKEGVGTLGDLTFTDNSSWIRSRKFRLGVKVSAGFCDGVRVREAKTEAFTVKDHRGELYKKHYPPALHDEVWRLDRIAKDGALHKKLIVAKVLTVEDFLRLLVMDQQQLRQILGSGMSNRMWENTVEHAKTCVLSEKLYVYYTDETRSVGAVFNHIYELRGLITNSQYHTAESLPHSQKVSVDSLVKKAYDNWTNVIEYDGKALLSSMNTKKAQAPPPTSDYTPPMNHYHAPFTRTHHHLMSEPQTHFQMDSIRFLDSNDAPSGFPSERSEATVGLALAPPAHTVHRNVDYRPAGTPQLFGGDLSADWSRHQDSSGYDEFINEDEIRQRSSEMLENDDMQHLLRTFSVGVGTFNNPEEVSQPYNYEAPTNFIFQEQRSRSSGKAVVGWLKLKAALRWGIFIRKRAAERRAQIVELE